MVATKRRRDPRKAAKPKKRKKTVRRKAAPRAKAKAKARRAGKTGRPKRSARKTTRPVSQKPAARFFRGDVGTKATRGLSPEAAGQAGDTEGLSRAQIADSESVEELLEEGQAFEAGIVNGVENAPDADKGGVRTREVPEDDVPQEYLDED